MDRRCALFLLAASLLAAPARPSRGVPAGTDDGVVRHTVDEALALAFPDAEIERTRHVLTAAQREAVAEASGDAAFDRAFVFAYLARRDDRIVGAGFFDAHVVRTLRETVLVSVTSDGALDGLVLCAFAEPPRYVPPRRWYGQFEGRRLDPDLSLGGEIDGVTGATMTARATVGAARRALALHEVLGAAVGRTPPKPEPTPEPPPEPKPEPKPEPPPPDDRG